MPQITIDLGGWACCTGFDLSLRPATRAPLARESTSKTKIKYLVMSAFTAIGLRDHEVRKATMRTQTLSLVPQILSRRENRTRGWGDCTGSFDRREARIRLEPLVRVAPGIKTAHPILQGARIVPTSRSLGTISVSYLEAGGRLHCQ